MVATRRARFLEIAGLTLAAIDIISNMPFFLVGLPGLIFL